MYSKYDNLFASIRSPSDLTNFIVEWDQSAFLQIWNYSFQD